MKELLVLAIAFWTGCFADVINQKFGVVTQEDLDILKRETDKYVLPSNVTVSFELLHNDVATKALEHWKYDELVAMMDAAVAKKYSAMIGAYRLIASTLARNLNIPYYVVNLADLSVMNAKHTMFLMDFPVAMINMALRASLITPYTSIAVIQDGEVDTSAIYSGNQGIRIMDIRVSPNDTDEELTKKFESISRMPDEVVTILFSPANIKALLNRVLEKAMYFGLLTKKKVWHLTTLNIDPAYIIDYRYTGVTIKSLAIPNKKIDLIGGTHEFLIDAVNHFLTNVENKTSDFVTLVQRGTLSNGVTGMVSFTRFGIKGLRNKLLFNVMITVPESPQLRQIGTWDESRAPNQFVIPHANYPLGHVQNPIRMAYVEINPFIIRTKSGAIDGLSNQLVQLIQQRMGFHYKLIKADSIGYSESGNWTGAIGMISAGTVDMIMIPLISTKERSTVLDFSQKFFSVQPSMYLQKPESQLKVLQLFYPLSWIMWLCMLASILVLSCVLWATDKISPNNEGKPMYSLGESFFLIVSSFTMAKLETEPKKTSSRVFTLVLWFCSLLVVSSYAANLISIYINPELDLPFNSFDELLKNDEGYHWTMSNKSDIYNAIALAQAPLDKVVSLELKELYGKASNGWINESLYARHWELIKKANDDEKFLYIDNTVISGFLSSVDCEQTTIPIGHVVYTMHLAYAKEFSFRVAMDDVLQIMRESGEIHMLEDRWLQKGHCPIKRLSINPKPLTINQVAGIFMLTGLAIVLGFASVAIEFSIAKLRLCFLRMGIHDLEFGGVYTAEVLDTCNEGVWTKVNDRPNKYFMHNSHLHLTPEEIKMKLRKGSKFSVKYFGKDPVSKLKRFMRN